MYCFGTLNVRSKVARSLNALTLGYQLVRGKRKDSSRGQLAAAVNDSFYTVVLDIDNALVFVRAGSFVLVLVDKMRQVQDAFPNQSQNECAPKPAALE